jgi:hypothetical protein
MIADSCLAADRMQFDQLKRRDLIALLGGAAAAWPLSVNAQPSAKIPRIGLMVTGSLESPEARVQLDAFRQGLRQLGYTEGRNIAIEYRGGGWEDRAVLESRGGAGSPRS